MLPVAVAGCSKRGGSNAGTEAGASPVLVVSLEIEDAATDVDEESLADVDTDGAEGRPGDGEVGDVIDDAWFVVSISGVPAGSVHYVGRWNELAGRRIAHETAKMQFTMQRTRYLYPKNSMP